MTQADSQPENAAAPETAVPATEQAAAVPPPPSQGVFLGTGRRKSAIARVRLVPGEGKIVINERPLEKYFFEPQEHLAVHEPLKAVNATRHFDVHILVTGGGHSGQAGAVRLGVARALVAADKRFEPMLRDRGYLTRDAREVERKKYGRRKARRRFQFSKR